jgi:uncharacterized protein YutE (UPF0331/DUF86 family)
MISQLVIDVASELGARRGLGFDDYTEAVRNLAAFEAFSPELLARLELPPGFRNVVIHEYVGIDLERAVRALDELEPVERFVSIVADLVESSEGGL